MTSVFVLGAGGHAKVLIDCLLQDSSIKIVGILDKNPDLLNKKILGIPVIGDETVLREYKKTAIKLVNGIGSVGSTESRQLIFKKLNRLGYEFLSLQHSKAYIAKDVLLLEGSQIMAGSIIQPNTQIGKNVIVNTQASVDHDAIIGDHVHLAPGVVCCGNVIIGEGTHVGSGAVIKQGVKIAKNCLIAAGAIVIHDINETSKVAGVPAKVMA